MRNFLLKGIKKKNIFFGTGYKQEMIKKNLVRTLITALIKNLKLQIWYTPYLMLLKKLKYQIL